ncbi:MAG: hypothetical protein NZT92_08605 [Abditibacteriales bacterium]|nr:hypothetical protein [Abditibacteriales bacterium]MDW8366050.1 hypothetical protein [Abditibacteriales bacterium]
MEKNGALQFVDTAEAASLLGVSEWAVLRDCESGRLPAEYVPTRWGVKWRVPLDACRPSRSGQPGRERTLERPASRVVLAGERYARLQEFESSGNDLPSETPKPPNTHEILMRLEERVASLQSAVESLTAQVQSLADENARLRDELIRGVRLPVVSVVQALTEANAELREQLTHLTVGCRKLAQFIFDLEEVANGSGTGAE